MSYEITKPRIIYVPTDPVEPAVRDASTLAEQKVKGFTPEEILNSLMKQYPHATAQELTVRARGCISTFENVETDITQLKGGHHSDDAGIDVRATDVATRVREAINSYRKPVLVSTGNGVLPTSEFICRYPVLAESCHLILANPVPSQKVYEYWKSKNTRNYFTKAIDVLRTKSEELGNRRMQPKDFHSLLLKLLFLGLANPDHVTNGGIFKIPGILHTLPPVYLQDITHKGLSDAFLTSEPITVASLHTIYSGGCLFQPKHFLEAHSAFLQTKIKAGLSVNLIDPELRAFTPTFEPLANIVAEGVYNIALSGKF